jgi:hypothetical protein
MAAPMTELFELEWMGGVAEHHYRKARPGVEAFAWDTLDPRRYPAPLLAAARQVWTGLALSEYAAIAAFADVVAALTQARAPLDLIGMTSDFLADEVRHVELVSRMLMQLGGAAPRAFQPALLSPQLAAGLTPLQRANELALRVGCIAEAFAGGTVLPILRAVTHPLVRDVYVSILRDEARHRRFGSLYFEWAQERLDDTERQRLGWVALAALRGYAPLWRMPDAIRPPAAVSGGQPDAPRQSAAELESALEPAAAHELGWLESARYAPMAIGVVRDEILPNLRGLSLQLPEAELAALLAPATA